MVIGTGKAISYRLGPLGSVLMGAIPAKIAGVEEVVMVTPPMENGGVNAHLTNVVFSNGIVEKAGAWYSYGGDRIGQGKDNVRNFLKENPDIARDIDQQLRAKLLDKPVAEAVPDNVEPIESAG